MEEPAPRDVFWDGNINGQHTPLQRKAFALNQEAFALDQEAFCAKSRAKLDHPVKAATHEGARA
jgi:hypothetical protein